MELDSVLVPETFLIFKQYLGFQPEYLKGEHGEVGCQPTLLTVVAPKTIIVHLVHVGNVQKST